MLILNPIEEWPSGLAGDIAANTDPKFKADRYYLPPWFMDRPTLKAMTDAGIRALAENNIEYGFTDRFMAVLANTLGIEVSQVREAFTCCFSPGHPNWPIARELVGKGELTFLHTIKTGKELQYILGEAESPT